MDRTLLPIEVVPVARRKGFLLSRAQIFVPEQKSIRFLLEQKSFVFLFLIFETLGAEKNKYQKQKSISVFDFCHG
jgi:hypothetical protein